MYAQQSMGTWVHMHLLEAESGRDNHTVQKQDDERCKRKYITNNMLYVMWKILISGMK